MSTAIVRRLRRWRQGQRRHGYGYSRPVQVSGEVAVSAPREGVGLVTLTGEHDLGTVGAVREALERAQAEHDAVVVDLCGATFIDSSILGAILEGRRQAREQERGFAVACDNSSEPVRRVLEVTGLARELPAHPSVEAALEAVMPRAGSA